MASQPRRALVAAGSFGVLGVLLALSLPLIAPSPAGAITDPALAHARAFVVSAQQPDGGFEIAQFPSFETPDAVLALAELAQTGPTWNAAEARSAVNAVVSSGSKTALDYLDDQAESADLSPALAAKYLTLVVAPLGLDPHDFDPSNDSARPVDLVAKMGQGADLDGRYRKPAFNGLLFISLAHWAIDCAVPADLAMRIAAAQQTNGSWNFAGVATGSGIDIDTTGLAVIALTRAGRPSTDPAIAKALTLLARQHRANGAWQTAVFPPPVDDPNTTTLATLAVAATGQNPDSPAWRNAAAPDLTSQGYVSPGTWLRSRQQSDGHITSPGDSFGVSTFATTQAIEALTRTWFTSKAASATPCPLPGGPREKFVRSAFQTLAGRPGSNSDLQPAATALGADPTVPARRLAAVVSTMAGDAYRQAAVGALYQRALGRAPDASGRVFWVNRLRSVGRTSLLASLLESREFFDNAGGTNTAFLNRLYLFALERGADHDGLAFWARRLSAGSGRRSIAVALLTSAEGRRNEARRLSEAFLDRAPTASERLLWSTLLASNRSEPLIEILVSSREFFIRATA